MRKYELTYLVSDQVPESDLKKATSKVDGFIKEFGGKVEKEDVWGRRKLAYPIRKMEFANYVTLYFELPAEKVRELEVELHQFTDVIRHLLIVKEYDVKTLTLTKEEIAETADIEKVIGGEKSFEAIEGETASSVDLMAKREKEEEPEDKSQESAEDKETEETPVKETAKPKAKLPTTLKSGKVAKTKTVEEVIEAESENAEETEKPVKKTKKVTKKEAAPEESERLTELNKQIEDILSDEL